MAASFPGAVKSFSAVVNGVTKLVAALFNSPYDEITAIETELGTNPKGISADVKTRLNGYDSGWFYVTAGNPYTKTHGLGTAKILWGLYMATLGDGSDQMSVETDMGGGYGYHITAFTTTQLTITTLGSGISRYGVGGAVYTAGYYKIVALPLE